jgi:hypothetical protein
MRCQGTIKLYATVNGQETLINGLVSDDMHDEILLSWHDMVGLGILSPQFPHGTVDVPAPAKAVPQPLVVFRIRKAPTDPEVPQNLEAMKIKFADVLGTTLDEAAGSMKGPKMTIRLKEERVKPLSITTARQIPLHLNKMAEKLVAELIKSKVLVAETGPTEWCSPAHFVPKPGGQETVSGYRLPGAEQAGHPDDSSVAFGGGPFEADPAVFPVLREDRRDPRILPGVVG